MNWKRRDGKHSTEYDFQWPGLGLLVRPLGQGQKILAQVNIAVVQLLRPVDGSTLCEINSLSLDCRHLM